MEGSPPQPRLLRVLWIVLALLVALLAGLLAWQLLGGGDDDNAAEAPAEAPGAPRVVSVEELREAAGSSEIPVYWIGPQGGAELELSEVGEVRVFVRYLTDGAEAGDPKPAFLAIGAYRLPNAVAALKANAKRTGSELRKAPRGALAWRDPESPTSVYVARPGEAFQIEVYDPDPKRALSTALSPRLRPVAGG